MKLEYKVVLIFQMPVKIISTYKCKKRRLPPKIDTSTVISTLNIFVMMFMSDM